MYLLRKDVFYIKPFKKKMQAFFSAFWWFDPENKNGKP